MPRVLFLLPLLTTLAACGIATPSASPTAVPRRILKPVQPSTYVALGASETYGIGASPHTRGYAYRVARGLHARRFLDLGIPGTTLDAGYQSELTRALAAHPALCSVFFGVNDLRAGVTEKSFVRELHDLVVTLQRGGARVLIIGMPDLGQLPAARDVPNASAISRQWNTGMARVARNTRASFLDLSRFSHELATHPAYVAPDGLHPSDAGHARLAQVVLSAVRAFHLWQRA